MVNPLCRPVPLTILGILFVLWAVLTARRTSQRWELVRAAIVTLILAELMALIAKRIVSAAVLVALNRLYIGAHWPIDIVGCAAIGMLAASITWLVAAGWPTHGRGAPAPESRSARAPRSGGSGLFRR